MNTVKARSNFGVRGWILTVYAFLIFFARSCPTLIFNATGSYFTDTYGWSNVAIQGMLTVATLFATVMVLVTGQITLRHSVRTMAIIYGIIWPISTIVMGVTASLPLFYVMMIICRCTGDSMCYSTNGTLVANWFPKKRGLVMGWATFGFPIASGVGTLIMRNLFNASGQVLISFLPFLILSVIALLLLIIFLRDYPEQIGCYPDNDKNAVREDTAALDAIGEGEWTTKKCFKTKEFWFISISIGLMLFCVGFMPQVGAALMGLGYPPTMIAPVMLGVMVVCCIGSYLCGWMDVKFGTRKAVLITDCILLVMGIAAQINNIIALAVAFACMGIVVGGGSNFLVSWVSAVWGRKHFKPVYRWAITICNIFGALATVVIALIADATNFKIAFLFSAVLALVGGVFALGVKKDADYSGDAVTK